MNPIAYRTTRLAIKTLSNLSRARVTLHGAQNIPQGAKIFVINHFTRLETFLMPYYLHKLVKMPIWSLASSEFFVGPLGRFLDSVGAVSTKDPDRDRLIVKTLLTNEAGWMIFPEGRMVKSKQIIERGRHMVTHAEGKHPPRTGAAYLALRTEFYRRRLLRLAKTNPEYVESLLPRFNLRSVSAISTLGTFIVPVNLTYYPLRARVNLLNKLAQRLLEDVPERLTEELMTEGAMLLSGVDIDIRFGTAIDVSAFLEAGRIQKTILGAEKFDFDAPLPCRACMRRAGATLTRRYMDAIYGLTTLNHDHIFASLLKHNPCHRIDLENFKRRAFLAICRDAASAPFFRHKSLQTPQAHLLIDDRYGKLGGFLTIAEETGVIERRPGELVRDRRKISTIFDFHRVRVDNPVAVIANEVEPLGTLKRKISRLCWQPGFWLRRRIAGYLLRQAEHAFDQDYQAFFIAGESKPKPIGRPLLIRGRSRRLGVVLCHGYLAAPAEVRGLADFLGRKGYWVYTPRLKGHGTAPEDLARCTYQDWIDGMEAGYLVMRSLCRRVVLGGFSAGAALALELAARLDEVAGVFAVCPLLRLRDATSKLAPVVDTWNRIMNRVRLDDAKMEYAENHPENPHINYFRNPVSGVRQLERLVAHLDPRLPDVRAPALVVQSHEDPVVDPKGAERIFHLLGSAEKQYLLFNAKRHGILLGEGAENVYRAIDCFIAQLSAGPVSFSPEERNAAPEPIP